MNHSEILLKDCTVEITDEGNFYLPYQNEVIASGRPSPLTAGMSHMQFVYRALLTEPEHPTPDKFKKKWHTVELLEVMAAAERENTVNDRGLEPVGVSKGSIMAYLRDSLHADKIHHGGDTCGIGDYLDKHS